MNNVGCIASLAVMVVSAILAIVVGAESEAGKFIGVFFALSVLSGLVFYIRQGGGDDDVDGSDYTN